MSAIYVGHVAHARPGKHRLRYPVFMLALDLDQIDQLHARLRLFRHNRLGFFGFFDRDHAGGVNGAVKPQIETMLRRAGIAWDGGSITLLTMPRLFNYVFNPLSVYFCRGRDGRLVAVVHEVSNTFGERGFYVLPPQIRSDGVITQSCDKNFFVSPFLEQNLRYEFRIVEPGDKAGVAIIVRRGGEAVLTASFAGRRRELTDTELLRAWVGNPAMTLMVIAGIHWEALRMWLKGVRYLGRRGGGRAPEKRAAA